MSTAAVCEHQAKEVCITRQDVNQETIQMLIETMLNVINHLEKKWLDEQMQREDLEQRQSEPKRHQEKHRLKHSSRTRIQGVWKRLFQGKNVPVTLA